MKNKKIVPIIVSVIAMLSVICISSFTREKPPKKQNDINNIAALSSKATADTLESDEEMRGVWGRVCPLTQFAEVLPRMPRKRQNGGIL